MLTTSSSSSDLGNADASAVLICEGADNAVRWRPGERLDHLFEQRCDALAAAGEADHPAIVTEAGTLTFGALDARANQTARHLIDAGIRPGDRVALLLDRSLDTYVALLAVLKANAAFVPLDASFPPERIGFILADAGVKAIVSLSVFADKLAPFGLPKTLLDAAAAEIGRQPAGRLSPTDRAPPKDELCYIIYTSGTTGNPKGVAIEHASICNFVRVAGEVYGVRQGDRAYQGMTIAFDFSVEELWLPLLMGATLLPGRPGASLVGDDLADFLIERRVTYLACVPTLLATIEKDLPDLRILLVSGEACPHNLVVRWHKPGRTILNAYGPTEATVTATLTELYPDKPVTIGGPLPTYSIVILDENEDKALARGAFGEIGIAGVGLACGYLNRDDLTARKFIPDFLCLPNNPSKRIYRTGDVGRITEAGEVEFHGRIDTQVKIRGYRIELGEIEAVISRMPQVAQAVVHTWESEAGTPELVAYYTLKQGAAELPLDELARTLKAQLPAYMMPAYVERLSAIPMTGSNKADRKSLPPPRGQRFAAGAGAYVAPRDDRETRLAAALQELMRVDRVSVTDDFFHDLGAHSLIMARFCSALRREGEQVAIKDVYLHPTVEKLARHLAEADGPEEVVEAPREPLRIPSDLSYYCCGALQLLFYLAYGSFALWVLVAAFQWTYAKVEDPLFTYAHLLAAGIGIFALFNAVPIAAKWTLIGRFKSEVIPIWSLRYYRFWLVKTLIHSAPILFFRGSPLYNVFLRMLGARIGAHAVLRCRLLPVCTDLLSIGADTILRTDCLVLGYTAEANYIYTGPVRIGSNAIVGETSVVEIDTEMEDGSQLGHSSSLHSGQRIPADKRFHGSPAQETSADYRFVEPRECSGLRRALFATFQLFGVFGLLGLPVLLLYYLVPELLHASAGAQFADAAAPPDLDVLALEVLAVSLALFVGGLLLGLLLVGLLPRLLRAFIRTDTTYPLFGFRYFVFRAISLLSNSPVYNLLFGDSALIVPYLRYVGYRLNNVLQTGSNFGLVQRHDDPFLCDIGSGTMVSDGLVMLNAPMSSSSFALREVHIGETCYLGNNINFPAAAKIGDNCLLGTKVLVPVDGPVRANVGLLGSPPFEIPRVVDRDKRLQVTDPELRRKLVAEKTRYNVATIVGYLVCLWLVFAADLFMLTAAILHFDLLGIWGIIACGWASLVVSIAAFVLMERASLHFRRLTPQIVSMYDRGFWFHERHWKYCGNPLLLLFKGTPLKNLVSRLVGIRMGKRVFDDGCQFFDKTLLEVGDYVTLNESALVKGHSLEEGVFKSDRVRIGRGCTVGPGALVHYGVSMGENVVLGADSFLMKGESPEPGTRWRGNPARAVGKRARSPRLSEVLLPAAEPDRSAPARAGPSPSARES